MLIFGSTAIKFWFDEYKHDPKDLDVLVCDSNYEWDKDTASPQTIELLNDSKLRVEYHFASANEVMVAKNMHHMYLEPNLLYTLLVSHLPWESKNGKWWKYLKDAVFLKNRGCQIDEEVYELYLTEWKTRFGDKSHIKFDKPNEEFFYDGVTRQYNHDELHAIFAIGPQPAYQLFQVDPSKALCSKTKFFELSTETQLHSALEEMFVIAFERKISLTNAYKALVTRMSKGWWNRFLIENAEQLLNEFKSEKQQYEERVNNVI